MNLQQNEPVVLKQLYQELKPGRVLVITQNRHYNKLAIILTVQGSKGNSYKVLVLDDQSFAGASASPIKSGVSSTR